MTSSGSFVDLLGNLIFFAGIFGGTWLAGRAIRRRRGRERDAGLVRAVVLAYECGLVRPGRAT